MLLRNILIFMGYSLRSRLSIGAMGFFLLMLLAGCASAPHGNLSSTGVVSWQGERVLIPGDLMLQTRSIFQALGQRTGLASQLRIAATPVANAYATQTEEGPMVTLNAGLIDLIGYDRDEMAFVLAHELAHLDRGHLREEHRQRHTVSDGAVEVLGTVVDFFIPLGGAMVEAGHAMVRAGYSRDDEREADRVGLALMTAAGFDPQGALRFQRKMSRIASRGLPLFATHPSSGDRIEELESLIRSAGAGADNRRDSDR